MGKPTGFMEYPRELPGDRAPVERIRDWKEFAWGEMVPRFVKLMPKDYKRMLEALERVTKAGLSGEEAIMAAFEANKADLARVSGN